MTDGMCHLCGTYYNDDPYFSGQPVHTLQKCVDVLQYRVRKAEKELREAERQLARAESEYGKKWKANE